MAKTATDKTAVKSASVLDLTDAVTVRFDSSIVVLGVQVNQGDKVKLARETAMRFVASANATLLDE